MKKRELADAPVTGSAILHSFGFWIPMHTFKRKAAIRIAVASLALAMIASPLAWFVSREKAEESLVSFAMEESHRVILHQDTASPVSPYGRAQAEASARTLAGGLFEIAEIYGPDGLKLTEAMTAEGEILERDLPPHVAPHYQASHYESRKLAGDRWVLRVFVPLRAMDGNLLGYFEGVRLIPDWQRRQIMSDAMAVALMVGLASLICGGVLYPIVIRLVSENERKAQQVLEAQLAMMEALGRAIAKRDSDTGAHNYRVAWMASRLAEAAGIHGAQMQALIAGSFLHDAGKIGIPDAILLKPGKLTAEEMGLMRGHVHMGEEIVSGARWLDGAREVVAGHHEKWDGSGYPRGLAGEAIPLAARVFAIADVFDALCSKRPYKEPLSFDSAMEILQAGAGNHFDPTLLEAFASIAKDLYDTSLHASEEEARQLLETVLRRYFEI